VLAYIDAHSAADLRLGRLAQLAACSPAHFHRRFAAWLGMPVHAYVQASRLQRAALLLAYRPRWRLIDIALGCGFAEASSFSRAFKRWAGMTPTAFRHAPRFELLHVSPLVWPIGEVGEVRYVDFPATPVAVLSHRGDPTGLPASLCRFIDWRIRHRLPPNRSATFNLLYADPASVPPADFRLDLAVALPQPLPPALRAAIAADGLTLSEIAAGPCAVLRHVGNEASLGAALTRLAREQLVDDAPPRPYPVFLRRLIWAPEVSPQEAVTDIYVPLPVLA
jgi:AraC family transcriptional regulator